jgi:hypothetical protein
MVDELDWVRRQLDRLAMTRLITWLDEELQTEYEHLARRERQLMAARNMLSN